MTAHSYDSAQSSELEQDGLTHAEAQDAINTYAKHVRPRIRHGQGSVRRLIALTSTTSHWRLRPLRSRLCAPQMPGPDSSRTKVWPPIRLSQSSAEPEKAVHGRESIDSVETIGCSPWRSKGRRSSPLSSSSQMGSLTSSSASTS